MGVATQPLIIGGWFRKLQLVLACNTARCTGGHVVPRYGYRNVLETLLSTLWEMGETHARPYDIDPKASPIANSFHGTHNDVAFNCWRQVMVRMYHPRNVATLPTTTLFATSLKERVETVRYSSLAIPAAFTPNLTNRSITS